MIDVWMFVHVLMLAVVFFSLLVIEKVHEVALQGHDWRRQVLFEVN
jgi:hypothetical protein